jgi:hypothetical protein
LVFDSQLFRIEGRASAGARLWPKCPIAVSVFLETLNFSIQY